MSSTANLSQLTNPIAVHKDTTNSVGNGTDDFRFGLAGLGQSAPGSGYGFASGVFPNATVNGSITDLQFTQNTSPNMGGQVNFGNYQVARASHGIYLGAGTSPIPVTFAAANASNPRVDYVVVRVRDGDVDSPLPPRTADIVVLTGTPAATPAEPTGLLTDGDFLLAAVTIRAATTQVLTGDIADRRVFASAQGGVYPASAVDTRTGSMPGQIRYNLATKTYEGWEAVTGAWVSIASLSSVGGVSVFSPNLYYQPSGAAVDYTKVCNLGVGPSVSCRYYLQGKTLALNYYFNWGTGPFNMGWGAVFSVLPFPGGVNMLAKQNTVLPAKIYVPYNQSSWSGLASIAAGSNVMYFQFPFTSNDCRLGFYQVSSNSNQWSGTGVPYIASGYPEGGNLSAVGSFETQ